MSNSARADVSVAAAPALGASPRHLLGLLSTWVFALLPANLVPSIIGTLVGGLGVDLTVAGAVATAMTLVNALGVLSMRAVVSRGHRVPVARIGVALLVVPALIAIFVVSAPIVLTALVIGGLGSGFLIAAATASIAGAADPDRATTVIVTVNRLVVALAFLLLPFLGGDIRAIFLLLVGIGIAAFLGSAWVSSRENEVPAQVVEASEHADAQMTSGARLIAWSLAVAFAVWTVSEEGVYGVVTVLMSTNLPGLDESTAYSFIAAGVFAGLIGALIAPLILRLLGRSVGLGVLLVLSLLAKLAMLTAGDAVLYFAAVAIWGLAFGATIPLVFGLAAKLNISGSANVLVNGVYVVGVALGPLVATQVAELAGLPGLTIVMTTIGVVGAVALVAISVASRRTVQAIWGGMER